MLGHHLMDKGRVLVVDEFQVGICCCHGIGGGTRGARGAMAPPDFWELKKNYPSIKFWVNCNLYICI